MSRTPEPRTSTTSTTGKTGRTGTTDTTTDTRLGVDRVACTGHGACAALLPAHVRLDEWGYPIVVDDHVAATEGVTAVRLCPARALYLR